MSALVELIRVEKTFRIGGVAAGASAGGGAGAALRQVQVLKGVGLTLVPGELVMLRGRSGSGKTTLLNIAGGLDDPTAGEARFDGRPLAGMDDEARTALRRRDIGFVFQSAALLPQLSARENVELSLRMAGAPRREWGERAGAALERVGLGRRAQHRPYELSGGERQRAAIAKAIAFRPRLLLADEPTAELDSRLSLEIAALFRRLAAEERLAILMTTHDETMMEVADRVYEMADGRIVRRAEAPGGRADAPERRGADAAAGG